MLKGQAKTDYQRQYMRDRRSAIVRPSVRPTVQPKPLSGTPWVEGIEEFVDAASGFLAAWVDLRPELDADGNIIPEMEG